VVALFAAYNTILRFFFCFTTHRVVKQNQNEAHGLVADEFYPVVQG